MMVASAYPNYRQSKMRWLPAVPEHWNEQRAKHFLRRVDERSLTGQEDLLSVSNTYGVFPRRQIKIKMMAASTYVGYRVCQVGDIVVKTLGAWKGGVAATQYFGLVSPAYDIYRMRKSEDFNSKYLDYLLRIRAYIAEYNGRSTGVGVGFLRLYPNQFLDIALIQPPRPEQDQIVAYLRAQNAHIARFIKAKRDLIKLLTEQKLRIIDHAVTRGLDSSVALRPSGIEWLGEVPEHWKALKLKFATKRIVGGSTPKSDEASYWDGGIVWVTPRDISKTDSLHTSLRTISAAGLQSCASTLVPPGSIVITSRAPVGNVAIARVELCTNQGCKAVVPAPDIAISDFLFLLLLRMKERLQVLANGTTFAEIGTWVLANEFIPVPPVSEQQAICRWITEECQPLDDAIARAEEEIKLIREYRDRLIADVVTGQIDVRGWQPGPEDVVDDAALAALGDENEEVTEEEDDDGED
ncbi:type I restriction modification DNA specificity domain protein [Cardiobacterium valvarum F0432]|uniref:Type I restriction modification DNA specificity domain protein n=2 Tax=Cardiobacterium valvarum TaxID=194702 RepID=G9ZFL7_9GAMM|nr:type I restriction modification DNA specificity domain protein [Cardiobacterium valvarum F0432]